ncbi:MAG: pyridoxal-phosphate-dependent aminotransferase family protein [Desulfocucumaceae bacterium]
MFKDKQYLMIPGPTPVPPAVMAAIARPIIGHRTDEFANMNKRIVERLQIVFQTSNKIFVVTHTGTGGMETAIANAIGPGDKVLALITGHFGERFAKMAKEYGADVDEVSFGWGKCVDLKSVEDKLAANSYKVVLSTQNETSTGVTNDIEGIGRLVANTPALLLVDGVSGVGGIEVKMDEWKVDILVTASQKSMMLPPGLAMVAVSDKAWKVVENNKSPRFYFSLPAANKSYEKWNTAYTPGVSLFAGLDVALDMLMDEGMDNVYARHKLLAKAVRAAVKAMGLELYVPDDNYASPVITSVKSPEGIDGDAIRKVLKNEFGVTFAGGQGIVKGKIFRIAHMGFADKMDVIIAISALEMALVRVGFPVELGSGVRTAQEVFLGGNA